MEICLNSTYNYMLSMISSKNQSKNKDEAEKIKELHSIVDKAFERGFQLKSSDTSPPESPDAPKENLTVFAKKILAQISKECKIEDALVGMNKTMEYFNSNASTGERV